MQPGSPAKTLMRQVVGAPRLRHLHSPSVGGTPSISLRRDPQASWFTDEETEVQEGTVTVQRRGVCARQIPFMGLTAHVPPRGVATPNYRSRGWGNLLGHLELGLSPLGISAKTYVSITHFKSLNPRERGQIHPPLTPPYQNYTPRGAGHPPRELVCQHQQG